MQYNYVISWTLEEGWKIDWETTMAKFQEGNIYIPNMDKWIDVGDTSSETYVTETVITDDLEDVFEGMRENC